MVPMVSIIMEFDRITKLARPTNNLFQCGLSSNKAQFNKTIILKISPCPLWNIRKNN